MKKNLLGSFAIITSLVLIGGGCFQPATDTYDYDDTSNGYLDDFTVEDLSVYINEPSTVSIGEEFTFSVTISNESDEAKELRSIDIDRSFLEGMVVIGTTTPTTNEYYIEALDQDIFEFEHMIPAYEDLTLVFTAMAFIPGDYSGDFDICIDGDASCLFEDISVTIE